MRTRKYKLTMQLIINFSFSVYTHTYTQSVHTNISPVYNNLIIINIIIYNE